jgi:hypothetical protein
MVAQNKKSTKKIDLLNMSNPERVKFISQVRKTLQQRIVETKLWQSLVEVEDLTINGNTVYRGDEQLTRFLFKTEIQNKTLLSSIFQLQRGNLLNP